MASFSDTLADVGHVENTFLCNTLFWCSILLFIIAVILLVLYFIQKKKTKNKSDQPIGNKIKNNLLLLFSIFLFVVGIFCTCTSYLTCQIKDNKTINTMAAAATILE